MPILKNSRQRFLVLILLAFEIVLGFAIISIFPKISYDKQVSSEIVIGIVTLSGLIFAFQPTVFKMKKIGFYRTLYLALFSVEGLLLGVVGYEFTLNALSFNYLTEGSLFLATSSLLFNLTISAYFVIVDLMIQAEEEAGLR